VEVKSGADGASGENDYQGNETDDGDGLDKANSTAALA
jgi:hypothetical protein